MLTLSFMQDLRDIIIIAFGITGLVALLVFTIFTALVGYAAWRLLRAARGTVRDGVSPALSNVQETVRAVRGTTEFVTDSVVNPFIKGYSLLAGLRRALGVLGRARPGGGGG